MTKLIKGQAVTTTIKAVITTTSNKVGTFKDNPKKSLYLNVTDKESLNKLNDLGIQEYTSKDGENFHIIKASESITLWVDGEDQELNTDITSKNFTTVKDDKEIEVELAVISGISEINNKPYHRVFAISLENIEDLTIKEKENPFK